MVPRPVQPATERERLTCWRRFLRRASVAMTRPHRNMRHLPKEAWFQLLCAAQAPQDCINAAKHCRCQVCYNTKQKLPTHTVSPQRLRVSNHDRRVRSAWCDWQAFLERCLHGTTLVQAWIVRESQFLGCPSSQECLKAFVYGWNRWAGWPKLIFSDRGTRCGSSTCRTERVKRRGGVLKKKLTGVVKDTHAAGKYVEKILSECLKVADEMSRHCGFAPVQWFLSRLRRAPAALGDEDECLDVGALQAHADGPTAVGVQSRYSTEAREAFARRDCGQRVAFVT